MAEKCDTKKIMCFVEFRRLKNVQKESQMPQPTPTLSN